jgi:membrane protein implicated in regulation of membrane protease activity
MGKERSLGAAILLASALVAIAYALLLYFGYGSTLTVVLVSAALYVLLGIVGWVGWTMTMTSSPKPTGAGSESQTGKIVAARKTRKSGPGKKKAA